MTYNYYCEERNPSGDPNDMFYMIYKIKNKYEITY